MSKQKAQQTEQKVIQYENGDKYEGQCCKNLRQGKGMLCYADGSVLEGERSKDKYQGYGVLKYQLFYD